MDQIYDRIEKKITRAGAAIMWLVFVYYRLDWLFSRLWGSTWKYCLCAD